MDRSPETVLDEYLVLRSQGGDTDAFTALVRRWQPRLARHALHLTGQAEAAADAVQETWLAVAQGLRRLQDPAAFRGWLYQVVTRKCADWVRNQQRQRKLTEQMAQSQDASVDADPSPAREDDVGRLREALQRLPNDRRALLSMSYLDGLSVTEIAQALSIPAGTVKSRLFHARQELKDLLERSEP